MEQVKGIEPSHQAWEACVLPLNYTCKHKHCTIKKTECQTLLKKLSHYTKNKKPTNYILVDFFYRPGINKKNSTTKAITTAIEATIPIIPTAKS